MVTRVRHDESTSNLLRHVDKCSPGAATGTSTITAFAHGSTYSYPKFRMKLALWVSRRHRPFAIVEDPELVDIFMDLNNKVEVPSHVTISRDVKEIFYISRKNLAVILQASLLNVYTSVADSSSIGLPREAPYLSRWLDITQCHCIYWCDSPLGC